MLRNLRRARVKYRHSVTTKGRAVDLSLASRPPAAMVVLHVFRPPVVSRVRAHLGARAALAVHSLRKRILHYYLHAPIKREHHTPGQDRTGDLQRVRLTS